MALSTNTTLKTYFNAGDEPTEAQFAELIDSSMIPGIMGLTAVTLTSNTTLAVATHSVQTGNYVAVNADAVVLTLPTVVIGATFLIVNIGASASQLLTISPNSVDKFLVDIAGAAPGTDNKDIINTQATQIQYDYVKFFGATADGWIITDIRGTWVDEA